MSSLLRIGLNPYGLTYHLGIQGAGTPRANPEAVGLEGYIALAKELGEQVEILGMDFCQPMLDEAELKKTEKGGLANVVFQQGDGVAEQFHGLGIVRDVQAAGRDAGVTARNQRAREDLRGLHGP